MAHTSILRLLKIAAGEAKEAFQKENIESTNYTRRQFIKGAAALSAVLAVPPFLWNLDSVSAKSKDSRIAIVPVKKDITFG